MELQECYDQIIQDRVPKNKSLWYEWATIKAYLLENPRIESIETYKELFKTNHEVVDKAPRYLIVLACMWRGLELAYKRHGRVFSGLDKQCLYLLAKLDEKALENDKSLRTHIVSGNVDLLS